MKWEMCIRLGGVFAKNFCIYDRNWKHISQKNKKIENKNKQKKNKKKKEKGEKRKDKIFSFEKINPQNISTYNYWWSVLV